MKRRVLGNPIYSAATQATTHDAAGMKCRRIDRLWASIDDGAGDDVVQDNGAVTSMPAERDAQRHQLVPVYLATYPVSYTHLTLPTIYSV